MLREVTRLQDRRPFSPWLRTFRTWRGVCHVLGMAVYRNLSCLEKHQRKARVAWREVCEPSLGLRMPRKQPNSGMDEDSAGQRKRLATPTGLGPALSALTGQCVKPLHRGAAWGKKLWLGCAERLESSILLRWAVTDDPLMPDQRDRCRTKVSAGHALDRPGPARQRRLTSRRSWVRFAETFEQEEGDLQRVQFNLTCSGRRLA